MRKQFAIWTIPLALCVAGCGTSSAHIVAPPPTSAISHWRIIQANATSFTIGYQWVNTTNAPEYLTNHMGSLHIESTQGMGASSPEHLAIKPQAMWYQSYTAGYNKQFPLTLPAHKSIDVFARLPIIPDNPLTQARWHVNLDSVIAVKNIPSKVLDQSSQPTLAQAINTSQTLVNQYVHANNNAQGYLPTDTTQLAKNQPVANLNAREIDLNAWSSNDGSTPTLPSKPLSLGLPNWAYYPGTNTIYWGITASHTLFATMTPPQVPASDSHQKANQGGTGNGIWTNGATIVFTQRHPNHGIALADIWA